MDLQGPFSGLHSERLDLRPLASDIRLCVHYERGPLFGRFLIRVPACRSLNEFDRAVRNALFRSPTARSMGLPSESERLYYYSGSVQAAIEDPQVLNHDDILIVTTTPRFYDNQVTNSDSILRKRKPEEAQEGMPHRCFRYALLC